MPKPNSARKRRILSVLFHEQDGLCFYCDREMLDPIEFDIKEFLADREANGLVVSVPNLYTTADHIWPAAKGGSWHFTNLVASCWDCNHKKASYVIPVELVNDRARMVQLFRNGQIKKYLRSLNAA